MNLLHIDSSALGAQSISRQLSAAVVAHWRRHHPNAQVRYRDLAAAPVPHWLPTADGRAPDLLGRALLDEFLAADVVVVGAPMYNFGIPSQLKAWIDRLAVPGETFRYTAQGPQGLAGGKRIIVASSRGGLYSNGAAAATDFQEPYLRTVFGFFGIRDVEFIRAEGVALGVEQRQQAIEAALASIETALPLAA
ncbi:MAG TPA: NAD(P)H-dependent oxidoreductase [Rhodanobacteraceae bacterium]|nr:NAD(P)H-dependent oxidoreductase [Rhodanobacteraceae bacterium]